MRIEHINFPSLFTDTGDKIDIKDIIGVPRVGSELVPVNGMYKVQASTNDSECVNGVCPIK